MEPDSLTVYDEWEVERPVMPARSRLFSLEPVGVGTAAVESLTGYVARLAEGHTVSTRDLVVQEILPLLRRPHLAATRDPSLLSAFWRNETRALNGTGILARNLVAALATLTGRRDLPFLTLLTWTEILSIQQLQRPIRTDCRRPSPWLSAHARPGHCPYCERWLGLEERDPRPTDLLSAEELVAQTWIGHVLGELLAAAPDVPVAVRRKQLVDALAASVQQLAEGSQSTWGRKLGLKLCTVFGWRWGRGIPSLWFLLIVCRRLGTTPLRLLTGDVGSLPTPSATDRSVAWFPPRPVRPRTTLDCDAAQWGLEEVLRSSEQPPLSLRQVAKHLGDTTMTLRRHFPELCQAISERHLEHQKEQGARTREERCAEVRTAIHQVHALGHYPSTHQVSMLLGQPHVVRSKSARTVWHETLRELGWLT